MFPDLRVCPLSVSVIFNPQMIKLIERLLHSEVNFASTRAVLIAGDTWPLAAQLANPVKNRRRTSDHSTALP